MVVCQLQLEYGNWSQLAMLQPKRPQAAQIANQIHASGSILS